ncbi:MAG: hypothetical protein RIQ71_1087 [Verrucomicrobiota bacterium]|jgi:hypothetical protein
MTTADPAKTISRAFRGGPWLRGYVNGKLRSDPVFATALRVIGGSALSVLDLGCGLGLLGLWLRAHHVRSPYRGCDLGGWKITAGNEVALRMGFADFALKEADMCRFLCEEPSFICAFDVIHYLPVSVQSDFLRRLGAAARSGSTVLLRTGVRGCGWRTGATVLEECWTRSTGWIRGGRVNFPRLEDVRRLFESEGCCVRSRPLWGRTPFSSHWFEVSARD